MKLAPLLNRLLRRYNIEPPRWSPPIWRPDAIEASLDELREYAEQHAQASISWYYAKKPWKALGSQFFRLVTVVFTAIGGAIPVVVAAGFFSAGQSQAARAQTDLRLTQIGYLFLLGAGLTLALDKFFGSSTGWMRYITTAMALETAREQFRFDWAKLTSPLAGKVPSGATLDALLQRISDFHATVRALVEKETQAWVTEFQSNLSQLEKDTRSAIDAARAQVETMKKESAALQDSAKPGAIDLHVANAPEADHGYDVAIDKATVLTAVSAPTTAITGLDPGIHEVTVSASIEGIHAQASGVIKVPPGDIATVTLTLVKAKKAAGPTG